MKNKKEQLQLDLFRPIYEIFHELCLLLFDVSRELIILGYRKYLGGRIPLDKIDRKLLSTKKKTEDEDALGIDCKTKKVITLNEIDFRKHSFIVGASGFGKTNLISILQEHSLRQEKPIIFFDPKGDRQALNTFSRICKKYKRPCYIFSEHFEHSISLNPVLEGTINQIVDRIMISFEWSEQFYKDASRRSLTKALKNLEKNGTPFTLKAVFGELRQMENKENLGVITKLEAILESDFGKILNAGPDGLTLSKIREQKACLYIGLSTQGYGETAQAIGKLFLGELLYNSYKTLSGSEDDKGLKNPVSIFFDEFGAIVTPNFIELQNKCRGAGMELTMAVQTASDIDKVNPELTKQIIENAANLFVLKQRLQDSAAFFSEAIGTVISKKQTYRIENGEESNTGTEREVHELLVHPDVIKNLEVGQCVLLRQGPTQINLVNVRNRRMEAVKKLNQLQKANKEEAFN